MDDAPLPGEFKTPAQEHGVDRVPENDKTLGKPPADSVDTGVARKLTEPNYGASSDADWDAE